VAALEVPGFGRRLSGPASSSCVPASAGLAAGPALVDDAAVAKKRLIVASPLMAVANRTRTLR
jgi:hypothetical protein